MTNDMIRKEEVFSLTPQTFEQAMQYAKLIADSDLAPKDYKGKPGNVLIAIQMGHEVGLKPLQALQNISVINGRASIWGDAMIGLIKAHADFEYIKEWQDKGVAYCTLKRRNEPEQTRSFSKEQAKASGLLGKQGPWTAYPERMLQMRARSWCCRDVFPDAIKGIHSAEESSDLPNENHTHKTNAEKINEFLVTQEVIDYEKEFATCNTLEELKTVYENFKDKVINDDEKQRLVHYKDLRKAELQTKVEQAITTMSTTELNQSLEDWKKDFDQATGEINN